MRPRRDTGVALGMVLLAITVLAALGVALAIGNRDSARLAYTDRQKLIAQEVLDQAAALKGAMEVTLQKSGLGPAALRLDASANNRSTVGIYHATDGATESQAPPPGTVGAGSTGWQYKGTNNDARFVINGVGTGNGVYLLTLSYVSEAVCQEINRLLTGSSTILQIAQPASIFQTATGGTTVLLNTADYAALDNRSELCVKDANNDNHYYKTVFYL